MNQKEKLVQATIQALNENSRDFDFPFGEYFIVFGDNNRREENTEAEIEEISIDNLDNLKNLERDDYQYRYSSGNAPKSIIVYEDSKDNYVIEAEFKDKSESSAKEWLYKHLNHHGVPIKRKNVEAWQGTDCEYYNDWVVASAVFKVKKPCDISKEDAKKLYTLQSENYQSIRATDEIDVNLPIEVDVNEDNNNIIIEATFANTTEQIAKEWAKTELNKLGFNINLDVINAKTDRVLNDDKKDYTNFTIVTISFNII